MSRKIIGCLLLSVFSIVLISPLEAAGNAKVSSQTKVERKDGRKIMTRILRIRVGESYRGKKLAGKKAWVYEFNKKDYIAALKSDKLIVLYFYDDAIANCKDGFADLSAAFEKHPANNAVGFKVNFDSNPGEAEKKLAEAFNVTSTPTVILIKTGEKLHQTTTNPKDFQQFLVRFSD